MTASENLVSNELKGLVSFPHSSRIWVFQSASILSAEQQSQLLENAKQFIANWTSHEMKMDAALEIFHGRFVVLAVNEQAGMPSGCGIDKAFQFIQRQENELQIQLLDRTKIAYIDPAAASEDQAAIRIVSFAEFESLAKAKSVNASTIVFNNMVATLAELSTKWKVPAASSWHSRYL